MDHRTQALFDFIAESPTSFHAVAAMSRRLEENGYEALSEGSPWTLLPEGKYYVTRNQSSLIAFRIPKHPQGGFHIVASHSDSPCFKLKEHAELTVEQAYTRLNVEPYGGMLMAPWLDRPLSVAGRIVVRTDSGIQSRLINLDRDLVMIVSQAIHMNREVNKGYAYNPQVDLLPLYGDYKAQGSFRSLLCETAGVKEEDLLGQDLFLYPRTPGTVWGAAKEFISAPRLDDLQCAFSSLTAFVETEKASGIPVHCVFDNEEVGSSTKQGAASTFLKDTLRRIVRALDGSEENYPLYLSQSFLISADNAHALHYNHTEKADPNHRPLMNEGIVIKQTANQKYTTDGISAAVIRSLCEKEKLPYQYFHNRSDLAGGSTLGNLSGNQVAVLSADIGLAQLAMHSPYETAGRWDTEALIQLLRAFYGCCLRCPADGCYELH